MLTSTFNLSWSSLISAIWPEKSAKGPSLTRTVSSTSYSRRGRLRLVADSTPSTLTWRMLSTSRRESGVGLVPGPTNPVTPGVLRMAPHVSSSRSQRTRR